MVSETVAAIPSAMQNIEQNIVINEKSTQTEIPPKVINDVQNKGDSTLYGPWVIAKWNMGRKIQGNNGKQNNFQKPSMDKKDSGKAQVKSSDGSRFTILSKSVENQEDSKRIDHRKGQDIGASSSRGSLDLKENVVEVVPETQMG